MAVVKAEAVISENTSDTESAALGASLERRKEGRGGVWGESRFWFDGHGRIIQQRNTVEGAGLGVVMLAGLPSMKWAQRRKLRPQQGRRHRGTVALGY